MGKVNFRFAALVGVALAVVTVMVAAHHHLPIRDPDDDIWPAYIRLPAIVLTAVGVDILPRALWRARRSLRLFLVEVRMVVRERWQLSHVVFALSGVGAWYLSYAAFRDLKSYVPFVNQHLWDDTLARFDRALWLGNDPAEVLHSLFGTGFMAHVFSVIYVAWIVLIPVSIAIALVWTRNRRAGAWYITALSVDWLLGVAVYYLLPTLGPIYSDSSEFSALPHTYVSSLQDKLWDDRLAFLAHPGSADAVQTIAAFPSLHVGMMVTVLLTVEYLGLARWIRITARVFLVATVLATIYLGWHFFADALSGAAVGALGVWIAALGTGNHLGLRPRLRTDAIEAPAQPQAVEIRSA